MSVSVVSRALATVMLFSIIFITGCGAKNEGTAPQTSPSEQVSASAFVGAKQVDPTTAGTVKGKILYEGVAPEPKQISVKGNPECAALHQGGAIASEEIIVKEGILQNVFVYVKQGLEGYSFTPPARAHVITNKGCVYVPHVSGIMVGQTVEFLNEDSTLHNIHSYPKNSKGFNLGLPLVGMKQTKRFDAPEVMVPLKCDVHPWMQGYVGVLPHPYFQVPGSEGTFELKNLPPGDYVLEAWHEKLGSRSQAVKLESGGTQEIEFKFTSN